MDPLDSTNGNAAFGHSGPEPARPAGKPPAAEIKSRNPVAAEAAGHGGQRDQETAEGIHGQRHHPQGANLTHHFLASVHKNEKYIMLVMLVAILLITIHLRSGMLKYQGFFEPDGFFHYTVVEQAIANNYIVPLTSRLSGFVSPHNPILEGNGTYYISIFLYIFLHYFGISAYTIMRHVPILFGIFDVIGAYYLVRTITDSKYLGMLAMFLVAVSSGDIARTAALVYRGDTFITIFLIAALVYMARAASSGNDKDRIRNAAISALFLGVSSAIWLGSPFALAVYFISLLLLVAYGFISADTELLRGTTIISLFMLFAYALEKFFRFLDVIRANLPLYDIHFFLVWIPILAASAASYWFLSDRQRTEHLLSPAGSGPFSFMFRGWRQRALFFAAASAVLAVVLIAFFGSYLYTTATLATVTNSATNAIGATTQELQKPTFAFIWASFNYQILLAPIGIALFLFEAANHYMRGRRERISKSAVYGFLTVLGYFLLTMYLQIGAVRFNSLFAVPVALFSAYTLFIVGRMSYNIAMTRRRASFVVFGYIGILIALAYVGYHIANLQAASAVQADNINPQFLSAMTWMRNNTPTNATVLALWPDGSVVEGWANRTSYIDSVGGEIGGPIINDSQFLFNTTGNDSFLYRIGKPQYLLARNYWLVELGGIAAEGNIQNTSQYGYDILTQGHVNRTANETVYTFSASSLPYRAMAIIKPFANGTLNSTSYLSINGSNYFQMRHLLLYNTATGGYTFFNATPSQVNRTMNFTLMVSFSNTTIVGAEILGSKLPESNLFKFLFLCNVQQCPFDNNNVSLQPVFVNSDSKIFRIIYH
ncbi:MAG: hypothetical protein M1448_03210 [Candidatus Marsarchaeota archaeon]|nr:hypothetical protein [Candidatus Marsarchaeota archaeon]